MHQTAETLLEVVCVASEGTNIMAPSTALAKVSKRLFKNYCVILLA